MKYFQKRLLFSIVLGFSIVSCANNNNTTEILIEVDDAGTLADFDVRALRLVLVDPKADPSVDETAVTSDKTDFTNEDGSPIVFPTDFTATVEKDRFQQLRIGVVAIDVNGRSLNAGFQENVLLQNKNTVSVSIVLSEKNSCVAGDAADGGCCLNVEDDDQNGVFDCLETACSDVPECQGVCQDGTLDFYRGESCDDGNDIVGDGCDANCISENNTFQGFFRYTQVENDVGNKFSVADMRPVLDRETTFGVGLESGPCKITSFSSRAVLNGISFADLGFFQIKDSQDFIISELSAQENLFVEQINNAPIEDDANFTFEFTGGGDLGPSVLFSKPLPQQLKDFVFARQIIRGEDYRITWSDPGFGETVLVRLSDGGSGVVDLIECEIEVAAEELIIPGKLTKTMNRGDEEFGILNSPGFVLNIGLGFTQFVLDNDGNPTAMKITIINGLAAGGDIL